MPCFKVLTYIDLFCGAGGFSYGFDEEGFKNVFSLDNEEDFCKTYKENFPKHNLLLKDIKKLKTNEINKILNKRKIDVIIGGPPCQGFSIAGKIGRKFLKDPRNYLFREFARVVNIVKPNFVVIENVERLYSHNKNQTRLEILNEFQSMGYNMECEVLNAVNFGVPQNRRRVFFIGNRLSKRIIFPSVRNKKSVTVKEAIDYYPKLRSGQSSLIPNHKAMNHTAQMLEKMRFIKDGGNRECIPTQIRPMTGDVRKYIRYDSKKPSVTVTGDMRKIFHYKQNRALTVRELAKLQSFKDDFVFKGSSISQQQQVGNAVPPLFARAIARSIKQLIHETYK